MKSSKKIAIIVVVAVITIGIVLSTCAMFAMGFDFTKLNTVSFETNTYSIDNEFTSISVNGAECDIRLIPSEDEICKVVCQESDKISHTVDVKNNKLMIERRDNRKWYEYIGIYWGRMEISIYLPQGEYEELYALNLSGDIVIPENFTFGTADIQSTSGNVSFEATVSGELSAKTTSGDVYIGNAAPGKLTAVSTSGNITVKNVVSQGSVQAEAVSGDIELSGVRCQNISVSTTSGDVDVSDTVTSESIQAESVSGNLEFYKCDAASLRLKTSSGDVSGTLLTQKQFLTETTSGDVDVPRASSGGKCEVMTTSGDIDFEIE